MRQKKIKYVNREFMILNGVLVEPQKITSNKKIFLEIGSGKGQFITKLAADNPENLYIAVEKNINVCYRIVQKRDELQLKNLTIILDDSINLCNYFDKNTIEKIYLNFSDPWPKAKHHKRRLTYDSFLKNYLVLLKNNGELQIRTDHFTFFEDSLTYVDKYFDIINVSYDHQMDDYYTEYEEKKSQHGKICECLAKVKTNENI